MKFYLLLEFSLGVLALLFFITQVIWPALRGRHLFPMFGRVRRLEQQVYDAKQAEYERELEQKLRNLKESDDDVGPKDD